MGHPCPSGCLTSVAALAKAWFSGGATDPTLASAATGAWSGAERHGVRRRSGAELPLSDGCVGVAGG